MAVQVIALKCPSCGGSVNTSESLCEYCGNAVMISSFRDVAEMSVPQVGKHVNAYREALADAPEDKELNTSAGMCFFKLRLYDQALAALEKAMPMNFDNSEVFFFAALCLLEGKMPFLHLRPTIDKILSYVDSAIAIEPRPIYYYFLAYIKYDYFKRKYLITSPDYTALLSKALAAGVTEGQIGELFALLGTARPTCL